MRFITFNNQPQEYAKGKQTCFVRAISYIEDITFIEAEELLRLIVPESSYFNSPNGVFNDDEIFKCVSILYPEYTAEGFGLGDFTLYGLDISNLALVALTEIDGDGYESEVGHITVIDNNTLYDRSDHYFNWYVDYIIWINK